MEQKSARDRAITYFLGQIKSGAVKKGEKILNERKLAEQLGISRVPLREAICTLAALGILEARQGDGTYVSPDDTGILAEIIRKYGLMDSFAVEEVFEARMLFEADAAALAAQKRTEADLQHLREALARHEAGVEAFYRGSLSADQMMALDGEVHLGIAASSHNHFMVQIIEAVRYVTLEKDLFGGAYTIDADHFRKSVPLHRAIVDAIAAGETEWARHEMQAHILQVRDALDLQALKERKE